MLYCIYMLPFHSLFCIAAEMEKKLAVECLAVLINYLDVSYRNNLTINLSSNLSHFADGIVQVSSTQYEYLAANKMNKQRLFFALSCVIYSW